MMNTIITLHSVISDVNVASIAWTVLTKLEIPAAILFYFSCIFWMILYGEFGVNQMDVAELNSKVNEYYTGTNGDLPPSILFHMGF